MTIPGPPPKGLSSTDLCASVAKSRMLVRWYSTSPFSAARLGMLVPKNGAEHLREERQDVDSQRHNSTSTHATMRINDKPRIKVRR